MPSLDNQSNSEERRMEIVAKINKKKQLNVPHLELNSNPLFLQRKSRNSSKVSSSSVSCVGSAEGDVLAI